MNSLLIAGTHHHVWPPLTVTNAKWFRRLQAPQAPLTSWTSKSDKRPFGLIQQYCTTYYGVPCRSGRRMSAIGLPLPDSGLRRRLPSVNHHRRRRATALSRSIVDPCRHHKQSTAASARGALFCSPSRSLKTSLFLPISICPPPLLHLLVFSSWGQTLSTAEGDSSCLKMKNRSLRTRTLS